MSPGVKMSYLEKNLIHLDLVTDECSKGAFCFIELLEQRQIYLKSAFATAPTGKLWDAIREKDGNENLEM